MEKNKGITLIALVVTIIVLIILASISISVLKGDNNITTQAKNSKEQTEIEEEKEVLGVSIVEAIDKDRFGLVTYDYFDESLEKNIGKGKYNLETIGTKWFKVTFIESKREYYVDKDGNIRTDMDASLKIEFGNVTWNNAVASVPINSYDETNQIIEYQKNGTEGEWQKISSGESITDLTNGDIVYAKLEGEDKYISLKIEDNTPPTVKVTLGGKTSNSITVNVTATDTESGISSNPTYIYYIKKSTESSYGTSQSSTSTSYTFTGLTQNISYDLKVEITDNAGNTGRGTLLNQKTETVTSGEQTGAITFGNVTWSGGKASTTVSTSTSYQIQYQINSISGTWITISSGGTVSNLNHGNTLYARLTDGINNGDYASLTIIDATIPELATIILSGAGTVDSNPTVNATVTHTDNQSGMSFGKYILNTSSSALGTDLSSYTETFSDNGEQISLPLSTAGSYYLHVLTVDKAGNSRETISNVITLVASTHTHTGDSSSGEGCYTTPVYHTHTGSASSGDGCYITPVYHIHESSCNGTCTYYLQCTGQNGIKNDAYITEDANEYGHTLCGQANRTVRVTHLDNGTSHYNNAKMTHTTYVCKKSTTTIESYTTGCGKTEGSTIESYSLGCGLLENQIISYTITY